MRIIKKSHYIIHEGDVIYNKLFAWKGTFGIVPRELSGMFVSDKFPTYTMDRTKVDASYLAWYFRYPPLWEQARQMSTGSAALSKLTLNPPKFLLLLIPLPPLAEQQRIVARIDRLSSKVEEVRRLRQLSTEQSSSLWQQSAAASFDALAQRFPSRSLGEIVTVHGGGTPSKSNPMYWEGRIPWISPKDMKKRELFDAIDHISEQATRDTAARLIDPGAVLVVVRGMILAHTFPSAVLRVPASINQDMKGLVPHGGLSPEFLCAALWAWNPRIVALVEKSTHDTRKLTTDRLLDIRIPVPPLHEQQDIVAELEIYQKDLTKVESLQAHIGSEMEMLMPAILDRAFKGAL